MIKKIILSVAFISTLFPSVTTYQAPPYALASAPSMEQKTTWTDQELFDLARFYGDKYGVSRETMVKVVACEAPWKKEGNTRFYDKDDAQSRLTYNEGQIAKHPDWGKVGERERSFGPVQIHEPSNLTIPREDAIDPEFSIEFLAKGIKDGHGERWTCY